MIKLVASDVDGTLINSKGELTPRTKKAIKTVIDNGAFFVAASGRQHFSLFEFFKNAGFNKDIIFLAENGAILFDGGKNIFVDSIKPDFVREVVEMARTLDGVYPVLDGVDAAYYEDDNDKLLFSVNRYFPKSQKLSDVLSCLEYDSICKIALLDINDAENGVYPAMKPFEDKLQVLLSGPEWVDLINYNVSKGAALELLCQKYGIKKEERLSFGDYLNDIEMMKVCKYSFAMKNAHPKLKEAAAYIADSNDQDGVAKVIEKYFKV